MGGFVSRTLIRGMKDMLFQAFGHFFPNPDFAQHTDENRMITSESFQDSMIVSIQLLVNGSFLD